MIPLRLDEVAAVTGGWLTPAADPATVVSGPVVIDSRRAAPGALFVCLPGERADGHQFAGDAVSAGAVAVVAARDVDVAAVVVADPAQALAALAAEVLRRAPGCMVVGVTGSSGKTSTKDLLAQVLQQRGPIVAPENSFNNEIGLPLTVLRITPETATLVCEYSARGVGHIAALCRIAPPEIAVVLNVGSAHLGEFGSRDAIATAKGELVEALPPTGTAVLNADDPLVLAMSSRTNARVVTVGENAEADVRIADLRTDELARPEFRVVTEQGDQAIRLALSGVHHASNAAAVVAVGLAAGLDLAAIADGLARAVPRSLHRMHVTTRADGLLVVDDAYNANPESMAAALDAFARLAADRRRWAVLGPMRELGPTSDAMHAEIGRRVAATGVDELLTVADADAVAAAAASTPGWTGRVRSVSSADDASAVLRAEVQPGDAVLVKASNSLQLWRVAEALLAGAPAEASA